MKVISTIKEMQQYIKTLKQQGKTVGFVPTMGFLHEGHLTLMNKARSENDVLVVSIFVNPLQFGPNEDFESYPRDFDRDRRLAENNGVDILFLPSTEEMYPTKMSLTAVVHSRINVLCGRQRNGHFDGVATVLVKLFNIVQPDRAYFGLKDAQQVAVVDGLITDFNFPITLVPVEIVREEDGLAKSSRNVNLTPHERVEASRLYESLQMAKQEIDNGQRNPKVIEELIKKHITAYTSGVIDYVEIYSYPELNEVPVLHGKIIIATAVKFTKARLIDNITFDVTEK
ncbi:pantoate--beta-alanine ligase [Bacillus sp. REN16]|uniref:pantoate--beta-alanine ligase n=1 Tax=Bacillus sp. REN16 TaxID=2887296 RepID=UPI001E5D7668|nr:pantoate--beta-alanine ligase [Bacillus sp. REN16]MCC3358353.1 pantoate--beta-alanine ligase [Bacillus sp. REN16]